MSSTLPSGGRRQPVRATRTAARLAANTYSRPSGSSQAHGYYPSANGAAGPSSSGAFPGTGAGTDGPGFRPALTHFTDSLGALPKEVMRHFTMMKEVEAKDHAANVELSRMADAILELAPDGRGKDRHSSGEGLSAANTSRSTGNAASLAPRLPDSRTRPGLGPNGFSGSTSELPDATMLPSNLTIVEQRAELMRRMIYTIMSLGPVLDEKIAVLSSANVTISKQLSRMDSSFSHIETEISEEARLGSLTHWALQDREDENTVGSENGPTGGRPRRRDAHNANDEQSTSRSEGRKEGPSGKRSRGITAPESETPDERSSQKKATTTTRSRKTADSNSGPDPKSQPSGAPATGSTSGQPTKRRKTEKGAIATNAGSNGVAGSSSAIADRAAAASGRGANPSPRTTPAAEPKRKTRAPQAASTGRKRPATASRQGKGETGDDGTATKDDGDISLKPDGDGAPGASVGTDPVDSDAKGKKGGTDNLPTSVPAILTRTSRVSKTSTPETGLVTPTGQTGPNSIHDSNGGSAPPSSRRGANGRRSQLTSNGTTPKRGKDSEPDRPKSPVPTTQLGKRRRAAAAAPATATTAAASKSTGSTSGQVSTSSRATTTTTTTTATTAAAAAAATPVVVEENEGGDEEEEGDEDDDDEVDEDMADADGDGDVDGDGEGDDVKYCYCHQVSYGEMVACDNEDCPTEWFHLKCAGLKEAPPETTRWYCVQCSEEMEKAKGKETATTSTTTTAAAATTTATATGAKKGKGKNRSAGSAESRRQDDGNTRGGDDKTQQKRTVNADADVDADADADADANADGPAEGGARSDAPGAGTIPTGPEPVPGGAKDGNKTENVEGSGTADRAADGGAETGGETEKGRTGDASDDEEEGEVREDDEAKS